MPNDPKKVIYNRKYYETHKKQVLAHNKSNYERDLDISRQKARDHARIRNRENRLNVLKHYSNGLMRCSCCGESQIDLLTIHHKLGNGAEHRKKVKGSGSNVYQDIVRSNFPPDFEILCYNCNIGVGRFGICPHKR
jgi:hypothetical protein